MRDHDEIESFPDLESLGDLELKDLITTLEAEEDHISHRRRQLHGRIDVLRAELVNRLRRRNPAATRAGCAPPASTSGSARLDRPSELGEPVVPLAAHGGHPADRIGQGRGGCREARLPADALAVDEAGLLELGEMLGDGLPVTGRRAASSVAVVASPRAIEPSTARRVGSASAAKTACWRSACVTPRRARRRGAGAARAGSQSSTVSTYA